MLEFGCDGNMELHKDSLPLRILKRDNIEPNVELRLTFLSRDNVRVKTGGK